MLCGQCRTHYHPFKYNTCYNCLPASRKEEFAGRRKFAEEMDAVMKNIERAYEEESDVDSSSAH